MTSIIPPDFSGNIERLVKCEYTTFQAGQQLMFIIWTTEANGNKLHKSRALDMAGIKFDWFYRAMDLSLSSQMVIRIGIILTRILKEVEA